jgi:hypothetical protein
LGRIHNVQEVELLALKATAIQELFDIGIQRCLIDPAQINSGIHVQNMLCLLPCPSMLV